MFRFFGGAPKLPVPDDLKSGVIKASFYDPEINRTYGAMAAHYSVGLLPARPRHKAKVEARVRFAQTYILGRLRALTFFSLAECNAAIALVMQRMNERPMRNLGLSRRALYETVERDALTALPLTTGSSRNGGPRGSTSTTTSRPTTFSIRSLTRRSAPRST